MRRFMPLIVLLVVCGALAAAAGWHLWGTPRPTEEPDPDLDYPVGGFALTERDGRPVTHDDLRGKVWIGSFVFTRCSGPCPAVTNTMARLQLDLKDELATGNLRLVTFTVDPKRDDLKALNTYANSRNAHPKHWLFLTGDENTIHTLVQKQFKQSVGRNQSPNAPEGEEFNHSTRLILVDKNGVIRATYAGLPDDQPDADKRFEAGLERLKKRARELMK
jgi:protein SCO1